jgi:hypothetical protein
MAHNGGFMRKIFLSLALLISLSQISFAFPIPGGGNYTVSAVAAIGVTDNATSHQVCRGVWIGTTQSIDLYIYGSWVTFQGATAGEVIPVDATGVRVTSGGGSPSSGDVVFLY